MFLKDIFTKIRQHFEANYWYHDYFYSRKSIKGRALSLTLAGSWDYDYIYQLLLIKLTQIGIAKSRYSWECRRYIDMTDELYEYYSKIDAFKEKLSKNKYSLEFEANDLKYIREEDKKLIRGQRKTVRNIWMARKLLLDYLNYTDENIDMKKIEELKKKFFNFLEEHIDEFWD